MYIALSLEWFLLIRRGDRLALADSLFVTTVRNARAVRAVRACAFRVARTATAEIIY